jgi:GNAT superfamily N-acetyltransferase
MDTSYQVDEYLEPGLRYTEEVGLTVRTLPARYCYLWIDGEEEPVSDLEMLSFKQRFGAVSVPAEGIGGVETVPRFRRQGYMTKLLDKALEGAAGRVDVAFVSEAAEGVYERFGFVNCVAEAHLSLTVRDVERRLGNLMGSASIDGIRDFVPDDLPYMVRLYNNAHSNRPWTHERHAGWNRLFPQKVWNPGSKAIVFEAGGKVSGYAVLKAMPFGRVNPPLTVDELIATDAKPTRHLFAAVAAMCWDLRLGEFVVREPWDGLVGREARLIGCRYQQSYPHSGHMMGTIMHRKRLLEQLEPELRRRAGGDDLSREHARAFGALQRADIVAEDSALLRLLLGYWSLGDARAAGTEIPDRYGRICAAWFPGGGTSLLPAPYAHKLDRY